MSYPQQPLDDSATAMEQAERVQRTMAMAIIGGTVVIAIVIAMILGLGSTNPLYVVLAIVLVAGGFALAMAVGYRAPASSANGQSPYLAAFFVRMAYTEAPMLISIVLSFVVDSGAPFLVALPLTVASMWVHLVPSDAGRRRWAANQKV